VILKLIQENDYRPRLYFDKGWMEFIFIIHNYDMPH